MMQGRGYWLFAKVCFRAGRLGIGCLAIGLLNAH